MLYLVVALVVLASPSSGVQAWLVQQVSHALAPLLPDSWVDFTRVEVLLNVVIVAPVSLLGSLVWPRSRWQDWAAYGFLGAVLVELFQGVFLPGREASFSDVVANTGGALLGALVVHGRRLRRR